METLFKINDILNILDVSRATLYRLMQQGEFPRPYKMGGTSVWTQDDLDAYMETIKMSRSKRSSDYEALI